MPKSKVFMTKTERKELSKKIKSRPRQANGRFVKNKPVLVLDERARKVEMIKAVDELDKTPSRLYFMKYKLKYFFFLFRWWLIGRNFCNLPKWSKKWWVVYIANKALWISISISLIYSISDLIGLC